MKRERRLHKARIRRITSEGLRTQRLNLLEMMCTAIPPTILTRESSSERASTVTGDTEGLRLSPAPASASAAVQDVQQHDVKRRWNRFESSSVFAPPEVQDSIV